MQDQLYIVSFSVSEQSITGLTEALVALGATRIQETLWALRSGDPATNIGRYLLGHIDETADRLIVVPTERLLFERGSINRLSNI